MSKTRIPDAERTAIMVDLVRRLHEPPHGHAHMSLGSIVLEEVSAATGGVAARRADILALGIWRNTGRKLHGYEVKASRSDLKKELAQPLKHRALARYCDRWTLVAWDEAVLMDGIPESWGIMLTRDMDDGARQLYTHRKPAPLTPEPWTRDFICSMIRNAYEQAPGAAYVARAVLTALAEERREHTREAARSMEQLVRPLRDHFFGAYAWNAPAEKVKPAALIARAVAELQQGTLFDATAAEKKGA